MDDHIPKLHRGTDPDALKRSYADLPDCVNVRDRAGVSDALLRAIQNLARQPHEHDSRHNYFIALAYLHGIDVEIDREKALELLASSAEAGLPEAADQLVDLYYHGIFVGRDYAQAGIWQQRKIEILRSQPDLTPAAQLDLADALRLMADLLTNTLDPNNDTDWNNYLSNLEAQGMSDWLAVAQSAYTRMNG